MSNSLWNAKAAADHLGVSIYTVYRYAEKRFLPHIKKKFGLRFRKSDLDAWLDKDKRGNMPLPGLPLDRLTVPAISLIESGGVCEVVRKSKSKTRYNFGYGAIYQRKTSKGKIRWYLDYRDASGKRIQKVAGLAVTKEEAAMALRDEIGRSFNREYGLEQKKKDMGFREFAKLYIEDYAMVRKISWKSDYYYLDANLIPFLREDLLSEITQVKIEKYIVKRVKDGVQKSTINRELACLRKLFNKAIDWGYALENPMSRIKLFSEKNNLKERVLTYEEERKLLASCSDYLKPIINTAIKTGMRKSEILSLKWVNVGLEKREIKVEKSKNGRIRIIPINVDLLLELERVRVNRGKCDWVFVNPATGGPFKDVKRAFKGACRRAGIKDLRFHDLRHLFASRLVGAGVDLITVKDLLGHGSVRVTERYTHSNRKAKKAAVDVLSDNPRKRAKKKSELLPICDTKEKNSGAKPVSTAFSIN